MTDAGEDPDSIAGLDIDEAVDAVVAREGDRDPAAVRRALYHATDEGVVTREGVEAGLAQAAKVVATPETRVELARMALEDAREAADDVDDVPTVRSRLAEYADEVAALEERVEAVGDDLQALLDRTVDGDDIYELASDIQVVTAAANEVQVAADDLQLELESFERWLASPSTRFDELEADLDALADAIEALDGALEREWGAGEGEAGVEEGGDGATAAPDRDDLGAVWVEATMRQRVLSLLLADVRAELGDLRTWADREDEAVADRAADVEDRLDDLAARLGAIDERLADVASEEWRERHGDRLAALEDALADLEPPVRWGPVQSTLERHLEAIGDGE